MSTGDTALTTRQLQYVQPKKPCQLFRTLVLLMVRGHVKEHVRLPSREVSPGLPRSTSDVELYLKLHNI